MVKKVFGFPLMLLALTACVTINIYFPAAAAEEAARTIVRDVLKSDQAEPAPPAQPAPEQKGESRSHGIHPLALAFGRVLEALVPAAHAAQADINISTPAISAIRGSMKQRQAALAPYYRSGAVGFDNNGSDAIRDLNAVPLPERNKVKKLVADENADRANLYREIARANGHPEWEADVRSTFAKVWVQEALKGYWYQDAGGAWKQR
ncbi:MAG: YdbL family protein [Chromatiaceae bacterium]|nr:YdbL family protein [Gammaproteobacteria bacterium]MCP5312220.1 YdbL family protein [Chromatiaceae bacterium]